MPPTAGSDPDSNPDADPSSELESDSGSKSARVFDGGIAIDIDTVADYPHRLDLTFEYADERRARLIHDAVAVEVGEIDDDRSTAAVDIDRETLFVTVCARDLVALRAGANTWIRLVETAEDVLAVVVDPDAPSS